MWSAGKLYLAPIALGFRLLCGSERETAWDLVGSGTVRSVPWEKRFTAWWSVSAGWSRSVSINRVMAVKRFNTRSSAYHGSCCHGDVQHFQPAPVFFPPVWCLATHARRGGARGRRSARTPPPVSSGRRTDFHTHVCVEDGGLVILNSLFEGQPNLVQNQTREKHTKVDAVRKMEAATTTKGGSELLPLFQFESSSLFQAKHGWDVTITLEQRKKKNVQTHFSQSFCSTFKVYFLSVNPLRGARVVVINHAGTSRLEETDAARITRITSWMRSVIESVTRVSDGLL